MKTIAAVIAGIVAVIAMTWVFASNDLALMKVFAPRAEAVRRETFEQSKAYRQGNAQELQNMQFQYEQASPEHKAALASIILHRAADLQDLPTDLNAFIEQLKKQKASASR